MPLKKGKHKTIHKHKKKGVKLFAKHKISADYPNKTNGMVSAHGTQKNMPRIAIKGKGVRIPAVQNKKQQQTLQKRRLPVEVMPGNDSGLEWNRDTVRVIDNISDSPKKKEPYGNGADASNKPDIKDINLTQAKKIREQVWIHHNGKKFETKCYVSWCTNMVDVFNFQVGHDTPKALGGSNNLLNLKPICQNCNQSMGSRYSIAEWNQLFAIQQRRHMSTVKMLNATENISNSNNSNSYDNCDKVRNIDTFPNKIDLYITETDNQQQTKDTCTRPSILPPLYTTQKMNYGPLARLVSYATKSSSISPINHVQSSKNLIIQGGITVIGAAIIAGSWLFGY